LRPGGPGGPKAAGISGIEKRLADQNVRTQDTISQAFEDLSKLMETAKDMVGISKSISEKLRLKQGEITDDEVSVFPLKKLIFATLNSAMLYTVCWRTHCRIFTSINRRKAIINK